jgi:hypothetical protein
MRSEDMMSLQQVKSAIIASVFRKYKDVGPAYPFKTLNDCFILSDRGDKQFIEFQFRDKQSTTRKVEHELQRVY